jgi:carotenoid cleavage dioxygenase-like enzyme
MSTPLVARGGHTCGFRTIPEHHQPLSLPVDGNLPYWLTGTLLRTAPGQFEVGEQAFRHWFDGLAMLHRFAFQQGRVEYRNRYLRSRSFQKAQQHGRIVQGEFATDPCHTLFQRVKSIFSREITDNCNVSVERFGEQYVALTETRMPIRFDPTTLKTIAPFSIDDRLSGPVSTAHPHFDRKRNVHYSYLVDFGYRCQYRLFFIDPSNETQVEIGSIPVDRPAYIHSMGATEDHLVLVEFPFVVHPLRLLLSGRPFIENYRWKPERQTRFHVIEKDTGKTVVSAHAPPTFGFHHVNAWKQDGNYVVDLISYPSPGVIEQLYLDALRSGDRVDATGVLVRYSISEAGEIEQTQLSDTSIELPRFNHECCTGRPYRFVYGNHATSDGTFLDRIVKIDVRNGGASFWGQEGCYPGEPVFVRRPEGTAEDDGVLLSVVLDPNSEQSFLLCLEAETLQEIARAVVPHPITFGFHGNFFSASKQPS